MTPGTEQSFPAHPIRAVQARHVRQSGCPCDVAIVTVDFEPGAPGVRLEVAPDATVRGDCDPHYLALFHAALAEGVREELAERAPGRAVALAVVVHFTLVHAVDSREHSFRVAGRLAAREALAREGQPA
ncbi:hypothetical protein [Streptomyces sp. 1331.2]|uniref:hypothetical protein n=1 Tax=Streptomyces sp. 1331.2 TaxID=1938835 RepID=UPI000BDC37FE|nr:hypothetical protein [Streptomyces sp. 1331.2]SOB78737.1 Elongation factor G, domain IV [Streptomyces sp. 1331.2]